LWAKAGSIGEPRVLVSDGRVAFHEAELAKRIAEHETKVKAHEDRIASVRPLAGLTTSRRDWRNTTPRRAKPISIMAHFSPLGR
jgi:hypothetical protein